MTRTTEHQQDSIKGKWESSGATEHCLKCHGQFNWQHPKTLSREARYKSRKIRESLEINRSKCDSSKFNINRDDGNFVKTVLVFNLCLKTTPTNGVEISRKYKVTVLIRCRFDFNLTGTME